MFLSLGKYGLSIGPLGKKKPVSKPSDGTKQRIAWGRIRI